MKAKWLEVAVKAVREARRAVLEGLARGGVDVVKVGASGDESLEVDVAAEDAIMGVLGGELDRATVMSEELGVAEWGGGGPPYVVVDPLDGSLNASRGYPCYSSSVALASSPRLVDVEAAAVMNLLTGDLYCAVRGEGATVNGRRATASRVTRLSEALISVDLSKKGRPKGYAFKVAPVIEEARYVRFLGTNALEISLVASGACDAFIDLRGDLRLLDVAGPLLMVREAGGAVYVEPGGLEVEVGVATRAKLIAAGTRELVEEILSRVEA